jgi:hypothetical protein
VLPRIIFDTSGINRLEDSGAASAPLMRGLTCGFDVILTGTSFDELVATPTLERREALLRRCDWLLHSAKCLCPPNEILRRLISAHLRDASRFQWFDVDVRAWDYEAAIPRRIFDDAVCVQQKRQHFQLEKSFRQFWKRLRPKLDEILAKDPSKRPNSYREAVAIAVRAGGVLWGVGQRLYRHVSGSEPAEADVRSFMDACPPFRAACYGLVMAWYNFSLRPQQDTTPPAGRNDLMTAAYLPYCERFVSDDWPQRRDLSEVATEAGLACEILSFEAFYRSLAIA